MRSLAALLLAFLLTLTAPTVKGGEPWLKPNDIVALVGGEDMVALAEEGWLETLVTWAQPQDRIRFRSLAWEGDTVFEQRRDLNYPTLETQLDKMGATVVICQFGKMESFAGKDGVAAFTEAYEKLLARLSREKKRRIALVLPSQFSKPPSRSSVHTILPDLTPRNRDLHSYCRAIQLFDGNTMESPKTIPPGSAKQTGTVVPAVRRSPLLISADSGMEADTRDGIHLAETSVADNFLLALKLAAQMGCLPGSVGPNMTWSAAPKSLLGLCDAIVAKNRLWFHYTRPQNWAFLAGNRTNQPSSRDHRDPSKRWFPEEMEQWLPLIDAKEQEIWKLAAAPR